MEWFDLTQRKTFKTEVDRKLTFFNRNLIFFNRKFYRLDTRPVDSEDHSRVKPTNVRKFWKMTETFLNSNASYFLKI